MSIAMPETDISTDLLAEINAIGEDLYAVIVHNDDVTSFPTVISALVELFGHSVERASDLAHQVHATGKAVADVLPKDAAKTGVEGLQERKITASMEKA